MDERAHGFAPGDWPFDAPENVASITTAPVLEGRLPVLLVSHDADDDGWQILCGTTNDPSDGRVVCLGCMVQKDPSLKQLADLPPGWRAWRDSPKAPWQRELSPEDDGDPDD